MLKRIQNKRKKHLFFSPSILANITVPIVDKHVAKPGRALCGNVNCQERNLERRTTSLENVIQFKVSIPFSGINQIRLFITCSMEFYLQYLHCPPHAPSTFMSFPEPQNGNRATAEAVS